MILSRYSLAHIKSLDNFISIELQIENGMEVDGNYFIRNFGNL